MIRTVLSLSLCCLSSLTQAFEIDFGEGPGMPAICTADSSGVGPLIACSAATHLSQSFADVDGVVDVSFLNPRLTPYGEFSLGWFDRNYSNLFGVAYASFHNLLGSQGRVEIRALQPGASVTLDSFYLGAYLGIHNTTVNVFNVDGSSLLFSHSGLVGGPGQGTNNFATLFVPQVSALGGIRIEWEDTAINVGIDRINYSVSSVAEPQSAVLLGCALIAGALFRRRILGQRRSEDACSLA
jgi:hypothetical protein